ncbi:MAG: hypothetical protein MRZ79_07945 [Bacteroidia bacterium]|nr:hypothetical protein [Bacteroidia bacterium]
MKKILLILLATLMLQAHTKACDICGCGSGLINPSIIPQFHNNFIGLRYSYLSFAYPSYETIDEMASIELRFRMYLGPKTQLLGSLPFRQLSRTGSNNDPRTRGIGDANLLIQRRLFEVVDTSGLGKHHQLWLGIGTKLATGRSQIGESGELPAHFQLGTGTYDLQAFLNYQLQLGKVGISLQSSFQKSISSSNGYFFGDQSSSSLLFFQRKRIGKLTLMPSIGAEYEWLGKDHEDGFIHSQSGGKAALLTAGVDAFFSQLSIGIRYRKPLYQEYAKGEILSGDRLGITVNYLF